jgi:histidine ammonia-lyase
MGMWAALKLHSVMKNAANILAIEFLAAAQGVNLLRPLRSSEKLEQAHAALRTSVEPWIHDREMSVDIKKAYDVLHQMELEQFGLH